MSHVGMFGLLVVTICTTISPAPATPVPPSVRPNSANATSTTARLWLPIVTAPNPNPPTRNRTMLQTSILIMRVPSAVPRVLVVSKVPSS